MSSSSTSATILLTDKPNEIKTKINKHAVSGGGQTVEEQREHGANLELDIPYHWLKFLLEDDDKYKEIGEKYSKGEMLTGEVKAILIKEVQDFLKWFQDSRAKVTDEDVRRFKEVRPMMAYPKAWEAEMKAKEAEKLRL